MLKRKTKDSCHLILSNINFFPQGKKLNLGRRHPKLKFQQLHFQRQVFEILHVFGSVFVKSTKAEILEDTAT